MRSRFDTGSEAGYAFYGGMLNAGYMTGFARRIEGDDQSFVIQQTNDPRISLPVFVEERNVSLPKDTMPTKVIGRFIGEKTVDGYRIVRFKAITLDRPSLRELPNRLAWEKPLIDNINDSFKPFFDPNDDEEVSNSIFRKSDKKSGRPCVNVARLAGYVESFAYEKPSEPSKRDDCLYIALRQTANPDESIPIRVYGRFAVSLKAQLHIALPIFIEGFYRVKRENHGTPEAPDYRLVPYIFTSTIKVATPADIKVRPAWWSGMLDRTVRMSRERMAKNGQTTQAEVQGTPVSDAPADSDVASNNSTGFVSIPGL